MSGSRPLAILAEDEAVIRMAAAAMLDALGFEVLEADHAAEALRLLEANSGAALLYTDIDMPGGMDGCDLAHTTTARWPETKIIVCSGCDPRVAARLPDCAYFLNKPCADKLVRKALQVLRLH
ncbi:response regulator [Methylobacterium sp. A49B]|uniref:Response regulator n=1 Tax=Methylobacterium mesophilicum SR1.6/6 TaxID=908290 RepID=A0A6B9FIY7_9HYPH|nr:response regulator [Methylobacterium mesophilicum]QGY01962.1 response regulator [Methylobacterium mesophilicum SR1.6/6]